MKHHCIQTREVDERHTVASFPGLPWLQFLIACSMQKRSQKAWWILPRDSWQGHNSLSHLICMAVLELIQSCPTRSTYVGTNSEATAATVCSSSRKTTRNAIFAPWWWRVDDQMMLKPFHRATTAMSASSYPTLSMLSPLLYKLLDIVLKVVAWYLARRKSAWYTPMRFRLIKMALLTFMTFTLFRGVCSDEIYLVNFSTWPS